MPDVAQWPAVAVHIGSPAPSGGAPGQAIAVRSDGTIGYVDDSVQVEAWGGKFDGVTDDTAAWQSALNVGKRHVHGGSGTSIISADLTVPGGLYIDGEGMGATTIRRTGATPGKCFTNADQSAFGSDVDITIADLTLDRTAGATGNSPYDDCIHMRYVDGITVQRVRTNGGMKGIHLEGCDNSLVTGNRCDSFHDNGIAITDAGGFGGVDLTEPEVIVSNNRIRQTAATIDPGGSSPLLATQDGTQIIDNAITSTSALGGNAIEVGGGSGGTVLVDGIIVQGNRISGGGILIGGATGPVVQGNRLKDGQVAASAHINVTQVGTGVIPDHPVVTGNTLAGTSATGLKISAGVPFAKVNGNYVYGGSLIYVQADDAEVCSNTVVGSLSAGGSITVGNCNRPVIKHNIVRNPVTAASVGIMYDTLTSPTIAHNVATSTTGNMQYGHYINAGTLIAWQYNDSIGHTTAILRTTGAQTYRGTSPVGP